MLIEFRVKNFRSLRDEQVLSLVASKDSTFQETHTQATTIQAAPTLLRSAVIFGANASGKSNLIKSLQYIRSVVLGSAMVLQPGQPFNVPPFLLDNVSVSQPTEFEVTFLLAGVRYQYGFALTPQRIVSEHLLVYKACKPQRWFERYFDPETGKEEYEFGSGLKGPKHVWKGATRANSLFLSMAVQLNSEQLRPVFDWFAHQLVIFNEASPLLASTLSVQMLRQDNKRKHICHLLSAADISIVDIDVVTRKMRSHNSRVDLSIGNREDSPVEHDIEELTFHHTTAQGKAVFDLNDESSGTRNLLFLAGPVLDILSKGLTLVIDDLDTSLHTLLVRELVRLFHRPAINSQGAQLVFTTHDTSLLDAYGLFRRDQIWFTEKDAMQASTLLSLSEFSPRKNEALGRGYLMGRYGAIPLISDLAGLQPT